MDLSTRMPQHRDIVTPLDRPLFVSAAASLVNVMASPWSRLRMKGPDSGESAHKILRVRVKVLPDPAPAVMARSWSRLRMKGPDSGESAHKILRVSVKGLPEPAPAETKSGRSRVITL